MFIVMPTATSLAKGKIIFHFSWPKAGPSTHQRPETQPAPER